LKEGDTPREVFLLASGLVEKLRTRDKLFGSLPVGSLIGGSAMLDNRPSRHTYRASSFVRVLRLPAGLFAAVVKSNGLLDRVRRAADLSAFLDTTNLFGDGLQVAVLGRIIDSASETRLRPGDIVVGHDISVFNIIRSGRVERLVGRRVVDVLQERDFFGEEAAVFDDPCLFGIRVLEETTVIQIPGEVLRDVPILRWKLVENRQQRAARFALGCDAAAGVIWNDDLSVHVARMDLQHKRLIEIANVIAEHLYPGADRGALTAAFDALVDYTRHHFAAEEKLMALYCYPEAAEHCLGHANLVSEVTECATRVREGNVFDSAAFLRSFQSWLLGHMREQDRDYGSFLNAKGVY
ncbi:MAG: hypothetical protein D4R84_13240, partial [Rhodocyclaceae bacterium]